MPQKDWATTEDFSAGFLHKRDVSQMPAGALILGSKNVVITDGDRVGCRKGSELFGASSSALTPIKSTHTFTKRDGTNIMMRSYGTVLEYYHEGTDAWENLNSSYTSGQRFGFADHNVNTQATDFVYFGNAIEPFTRWNGAYTQLNGALAGGEATITVDSNLTSDVFFSGTASAVTTTTLTIATTEWATDLWNTFYVKITSGASSGKIGKISATTGTQITFATITGLAGTPTFEIRKLAFDDANKNIRIGTTTVTWTSVDNETTFNGCSNTPAAADNAAVAQAVETTLGNPRGNIYLVLNTRLFIAGVKKSPSSIFFSKIADANNFTFSSPRAADDGGVIDMPEGGGDVRGLGIQEDVIYALKRDITKTVSFSQDGNDLPQVKPLIQSPLVGATSQLGVFKVDNQLFHVSPEGAVKSTTRSSVVDFAKPFQLSDKIKTFADSLTFTNAAGIYFKQKAYIAAQSADSTANDVVIVYNFQKNAWEAPIYGWNVACWTVYNGELYFGSSFNPETYKAEISEFTDNDLSYECVARFSYNNYGSPELPKKFSTLFLEGFISDNTTITVRALYNYLGSQEIREGSLAGTEDDYIVGGDLFNLLGNSQLALMPLAGADVDETAPSSLRKFRVYFTTTYQPFYELSLEISSNSVGAQWEILRFSTDAVLLPNPVTELKKKLA